MMNASVHIIQIDTHFVDISLTICDEMNVYFHFGASENWFGQVIFGPKYV